jgi:hypothetical protein
VNRPWGKSLLGYAHKPFNARARIKVRSGGNRGATLAKRIVSEVEVGLLIRPAPSKRDRVLLEVAYAGGLRVSEIVAVNWADDCVRAVRVPQRVRRYVSIYVGHLRRTFHHGVHRALCKPAATFATCEHGIIGAGVAAQR